jgi:hypothetical protein
LKVFFFFLPNLSNQRVWVSLKPKDSKRLRFEAFMGSRVKRNWTWTSVARITFFAIIAIFGSILGFLQSIQDFLSRYLKGIQFNIAQLALIAIGIVGIVIVVYDAQRKRVGTSMPSEDQPSEFDAEVSPREGLRVGDTVIFKVRFVGKLTNGIVGTQIRFPDGTLIASLDHSTISHHPSAFTKGKLNGFVNYKSNDWSWVIPDSAGPGKYEFQIRVANHIPHGRYVTLRLKLLLPLSKSISSIDVHKLAYPRRETVKQKVETVIVHERTGFSV